VQSKVDESVYYKGLAMYILYTEDSILARPDCSDVELVIEEIQSTNLNITIKGDIA
jgi:hypothetical protein